MLKKYFLLIHKRIFLFFLSLIAIFFELIVLYVQYIIYFNPCVLCIYQRFALYGLILSGIISTFTNISLLYFFSISLWIYSSWKGLLIAIKQTKIHFFKFKFNCYFIFFPYWLPLDRWLPAVFSPTGDCSEPQIIFLSLTISQWMIIIFLIYLLIGLFRLITYFFIFKNINMKL